MTDKELKERWMHDLSAPAEALVRTIAQAHAQEYAHLQFQSAVWLNAKADPWECGVDLLELYDVLPVDPDADFHPTVFKPANGWPRLRVILSSFQELHTRLEIEESTGCSDFVTDLIRKLHTGDARVVNETDAGRVATQELLRPRF